MDADDKYKNLREKIILASLKYTTYTFNILIIAAIVGIIMWWINLIVASM